MKSGRLRFVLILCGVVLILMSAILILSPDRKVMDVILSFLYLIFGIYFIKLAKKNAQDTAAIIKTHSKSINKIESLAKWAYLGVFLGVVLMTYNLFNLNFTPLLILTISGASFVIGIIIVKVVMVFINKYSSRTNR